MGWLGIALILAYYAIGTYLSNQAHRFLKNPQRTRFTTPLFTTGEYRDEAAPFRQRAIRFWWFGGLALILALGVLAWLS